MLFSHSIPFSPIIYHLSSIHYLYFVFIKIYFNDKPLFLCDAIDESIQPFVHHDDAVFIDELNLHSVKSMIHEMELPKVHAGVFYHPRLEELKKDFFKRFKHILAAGGLVENEKGELLLIFRRGKWDLPKGKVDKGEKMEDCALREVKEETGLKELKLGQSISTTYHTYHEGSKHILKESHWWLMKTQGNDEVKPQTEEDITDIKWVKKSDLKKYLSNSFALVNDLLQPYIQ